MRTEIKSVQLLIPAHTHLQRVIKSNVCSSFQLKKLVWESLLSCALIGLTTVCQKTESFIQQKIS